MHAYTLTDLISEESTQIVINAGAPVDVIWVSVLERTAGISVTINNHNVTATCPIHAIVCFDSPLDMAGI